MYDEYKARIILETIENISSVKRELIFSKTRVYEAVKARQLLHFFLIRYVSKNLSLVGKNTNRSHCTVIHSIKTINNAVETNLQPVTFIFFTIDSYLKRKFRENPQFKFNNYIFYPYNNIT